MNRTSLPSLGPALGAVVALTLTLALGLSGCGGKAGTTKHDDPVVDYKSAASKVCRDAFAKMTTIGDDVADKKHPTRAEKTAAAGRIAAGLTEERDRLKALTPPASLAAGVQTLLGSLQKVIDAATSQGAGFIKANTQPFAQVEADANAIGLHDCAY